MYILRQHYSGIFHIVAFQLLIRRSIIRQICQDSFAKRNLTMFNPIAGGELSTDELYPDA
jgi:hypothetical protein